MQKLIFFSEEPEGRKDIKQHMNDSLSLAQIDSAPFEENPCDTDLDAVRTRLTDRKPVAFHVQPQHPMVEENETETATTSKATENPEDYHKQLVAIFGEDLAASFAKEGIKFDLPL